MNFRVYNLCSQLTVEYLCVGAQEFIELSFNEESVFLYTLIFVFILVIQITKKYQKKSVLNLFSFSSNLIFSLHPVKQSRYLCCFICHMKFSFFIPSKTDYR
jgi:energy-coupling factor transporter transmembrane protein EcfT